MTKEQARLLRSRLEAAVHWLNRLADLGDLLLIYVERA